MAEKSLSSKGMLESEEEFGAAYETYAQPIHRFFYWRTGDNALSEDLTSSVFEKAWRSRHSFRGGSAGAWLHRIARNLLIDHWRAKQAVPLADDDSLISDALPAGETLDKQFAAEQLQRALDTLPSDMRTIVELRFIDGLSVKRVAALVGTTEGNIRVIQYRALKKMRHYLDD